MANQYKTALDEAVQELSEDLLKANVSYDPVLRTITWSGLVFKIDPGTTKKEILPKLRKIIDFNNKVQIRKNQGALL